METRKITFENATIEDLLINASLVNWYAEEIANLPNTHTSTLLKNAFFKEVVLKTSVKALENEVALITSTIDNLGVDEDNVCHFYATMINRLIESCVGTSFPDFVDKKELEKIIDWEIEELTRNEMNLSDEEMKDEIQTLAYEIYRHYYFTDDIELGFAFAKRGTDLEKVKAYTLKAYDVNVDDDDKVNEAKMHLSNSEEMLRQTNNLLDESDRIKSQIIKLAKDYDDNKALIDALLDRLHVISKSLGKLEVYVKESTDKAEKILMEDLLLDTSDCIKDEDVKQGRTTLYTHDQVKTYIIEAIFEDGVDDYVDLYDYVNEIGMPEDAIKMLRSILLLDESCMDRKNAEGLAKCWVETYYKFA